MKSTKLLEIFNTLASWYEGKATLFDVCDLLGDETHDLPAALIASAIVDFHYRPIEGISFQAIQFVVLLYLAMRNVIRQRATPMHQQHR